MRAIRHPDPNKADGVQMTPAGGGNDIGCASAPTIEIHQPWIERAATLPEECLGSSIAPHSSMAS
jgi:hypothetical protein